MDHSQIKCLADLSKLRTAPELNDQQSETLLRELRLIMKEFDWFTIGILAPSANQAISVLRKIEKDFNWSAMQLKDQLEQEGPVFLKANQNTGDIHLRVEYGLGIGVLFSGHQSEPNQPVNTWGPLPLDVFSD